MKRNKNVIIGLACGFGCMICVGLYVAQVDAQAAAAQAEALARYGGEQIEVCVARRDIAAGETIDEAAVETKMWIASLLPEDAVTEKRAAVGQQVGSGILEGEVVSRKRFGSSTTTLEVPEGLAAVSVPARDVQAIGGALAPGMKPDVYAIGASGTTKLVSQALVVATSSAGSSGGSSGSTAWVTLAVAPSSVEELVSAAQNLELYFVLAGNGAGAGGGAGAEGGGDGEAGGGGSEASGGESASGGGGGAETGAGEDANGGAEPAGGDAQ